MRSYLQAAMHTTAEDDAFGYRHSTGVGGTVHQHAWNWKVDLDVAGEHGMPGCPCERRAGGGGGGARG